MVTLLSIYKLVSVHLLVHLNLFSLFVIKIILWTDDDQSCSSICNNLHVCDVVSAQH